MLLWWKEWYHVNVYIHIYIKWGYKEKLVLSLNQKQNVKIYIYFYCSIFRNIFLHAICIDMCTSRKSFIDGYPIPTMKSSFTIFIPKPTWIRFFCVVLPLMSLPFFLCFPQHSDFPVRSHFNIRLYFNITKDSWGTSKIMYVHFTCVFCTNIIKDSIQFNSINECQKLFFVPLPYR